MIETNFILVENAYGDTRVHEFSTIEEALEAYEDYAEGSSPEAKVYAVCELNIVTRAALLENADG